MNTKLQSATCDMARDPVHRPVSSAQKGFGLIELMIAMTISLILLAGVVQIYSNSKQTYRSQEANSRLQESGRTAIAILQRDIRSAGFQGCRSMSAVTPSVIASGPIPTIDASTIIRGYEGSSGNWTPALPATLGTVTSNTDVVTIQRASNCGASLTGNMTAVNANVQINSSNACGFSANQVLVISDCVSVDIFRTSGVSSGTAGIESIAHAANVNGGKVNLSKPYGNDSNLLGFSSPTYFIATGANGQPSLWRFDNTSAPAAGVNPIELVNNVADMQIEYGVDDRNQIDGITNFYTTADNIFPVGGNNDWDLVTSVRITLLIQSPSDNITTQAQTYTYNRATVTAPDRRIYRVFTTTISLRNKVS